jgi:hypothetical protein
LPADLGQQLPDGTPIVPSPEAPEAEVPVVEEPAEEVEEVEEVEGEEVEEIEALTETPQASVGNAMLEAVASLNTRLQAMEARAMAAEARVVIAEAEARQHAEDHDRLARSLGIAAASVVPELNTAAGSKPSLLEEYNAISDPAERSAFYRKHRAELVKLVTSAG